MATENVSMDIENKEVQTEPSNSNTVRLTGEMLSKVNVSVNMKFLSDIRNIIEVATQRGAWKANELTTIGSLVDSLDNAFKQLADKNNEIASAASESQATSE